MHTFVEKLIVKYHFGTPRHRCDNMSKKSYISTGLKQLRIGCNVRFCSNGDEPWHFLIT
jgi:hypothetical protein